MPVLNGIIKRISLITGAEKMNTFWTGFVIGALAIIGIGFVGKQIHTKYFKNKHSHYFKFIIPVIAITIAFIIIILNLDALVNPIPIGKKGILEYVLSNKAILYLLTYIGVLSLFAVVWIITVFPFSFNGLKKFSGFGVSAEFNEKVQEVVESRSIINEMAAIRENTLNIVITDDYYKETLINVINRQGDINTGMFVGTVLDTIVSIFAKSESKLKIKVHHELVYLSKIVEAKESLKELQKEMSIASLDVIRNKRPSVWENTLAIPINPFNIEEDLEAFYIVCIHSVDVKFSENDIDFFTTVFKVVESFVELDWYKTEAETEQTNSDPTTESTGS